MIEKERFHIVAVNNKGDAERFPAELSVDETLATLGANAICAADKQLSDLLFECGGFFWTTDQQIGVSITSFRRVFEDIALVILRPVPPHWNALAKPVCTCHVYGVQQQCQHSLFVESLGLPGIANPRNLHSDSASSRAPEGQSQSCRKASSCVVLCIAAALENRIGKHNTHRDSRLLIIGSLHTCFFKCIL